MDEDEPAFIGEEESDPVTLVGHEEVAEKFGGVGGAKKLTDQ